MVYRAHAHSKGYRVLGGRKSEPFDDVWPPVFSPDGKKVAFGARKERELRWQAMILE